jgi:hypothetical protein
MPFVYKPHGLYAAKFNPARCAASVRVGYHSTQCTATGVLKEDGHTWCRKHAPSAEKARRAKSDEKYRLEAAARDRASKIHAAEVEVQRVAVECFDANTPLPPTLIHAIHALKKLRGG